MKIPVVLTSLGLLAFASCGEVKNLVSTPKITIGMAINTGGPCPGATGLAALHSCGPNSDEIQQSFKSAFASESACHGIQLRELAEQEYVIPEDTPGYLDIVYRPPNDWVYVVRYNGNSLTATVKSERELVEQVCRIVKGTGGTVKSNVDS